MATWLDLKYLALSRKCKKYNELCNTIPAT